MIFENEITVEVSISLDELKDLLYKNNFLLKNEYDLNDIYMIKNNCDSENPLEMLKQCILIRYVIEEDKEKKLITYKHKEYNEEGEILKQGKIDCSINSIEDAYLLFQSIGYKELIRINNHSLVFANEFSEFAVQCVNDKHVYIEIEQENNYIDKVYETIDEMKNEIEKYNIPIKDNDYFVKKAVIEINEKNKNTYY